MNQNNAVSPVFSWMFGVIVVAIGIVNTFWGGDTGFGIFILLLSLAYFLPLRSMLNGKLSPAVIIGGKVILGLFIFWAAMGVGELPDKAELMIQSFSS
jgi:hypothetical protein